MSPSLRSKSCPQSCKLLSEEIQHPYVPKYEGSSQVGAVRMIIKDDGRGIFGCASRFTSEGPRAPAFPGGLLINMRGASRRTLGTLSGVANFCPAGGDGISRSNAGWKDCGKTVRLITPRHTTRIRRNVPESHRQDRPGSRILVGVITSTDFPGKRCHRITCSIKKRHSGQFPIQTALLP